MTNPVRLVDGHGCWTVVPRDELIRDQSGAFFLPGVGWRRLAFRPRGRDADGLPMLVSDAPTTGSMGRYDPTCLPHGWHAPED